MTPAPILLYTRLPLMAPRKNAPPPLYPLWRLAACGITPGQGLRGPRPCVSSHPWACRPDHQTALTAALRVGMAAARATAGPPRPRPQRPPAPLEVAAVPLRHPRRCCQPRSCLRRRRSGAVPLRTLGSCCSRPATGSSASYCPTHTARPHIPQAWASSPGAGGNGMAFVWGRTFWSRAKLSNFFWCARRAAQKHACRHATVHSAFHA